MKKRMARLSAMIMVLVFMASGCASRPEEIVYSDESVVRDEQVEYPEYQEKLNQIQPVAYNNVNGLELMPGTYITILGKDSEGPFWNAMKDGVKQAEEDINANLGYEGKEKVKVNFVAPSKGEGVDQQVNLLDEELDLYPAALAISILDIQACEVQFDLAYRNGIPIVAVDSASSYKEFAAKVGTNNSIAAKECADHLAELTGSEGEIVIFAQEYSSEAVMTRIKAFKSEMKEKYPDMKVAAVLYPEKMDALKEKIAAKINAGKYRTEEEELSVLETTPKEEAVKEPEITADQLTNQDVVDYILRTRKNLKGVYGLNGDELEKAREALIRNGMEDVYLVGFDVSDNILQYVREGSIDGVILQNPFGMGYASVVASARAALGMGNKDYIDSQYKWVTRENVDTDEIQKLLYE